jgi:hypothetical protein
MDRNIAPALGFATSSVPSTGTFIGISNIMLRLATATIVTSIPHRMLAGSRFRLVTKTGQASGCQIGQVLNDFTFTAAIGTTTGSIPGSLLQVNPENMFVVGQTVSGIDSLCIGSRKIDLSIAKRNVLIRCILNHSIEIGNLFLSHTNTRFLARVQLKAGSNSIQFSTDLDHTQGVYVLPKPINRVDNIRLELYSDTSQGPYDLQGLDWSLLANFICDNDGR